MMWRLLLALMVLGNAQALSAQTEAEKDKPAFQPAEAVSVTDILDSIQSMASGTVVLDAVITDTGSVDRVEVRRDIVSLTQPAADAVKGWTFSAATWEGKAIASRVPVAVTFRPPLWYTDPVPLPPLVPQSESAVQAEFQPPQVTHAAFPKFPWDAAGGGSVVLEVSLNEKGEVEGELKVLRDFAPFTDLAKAAVGDFRFMPAAYNGKPVPAKVVLAFVFRQVISTSP
jgi:hypothetical protein